MQIITANRLVDGEVVWMGAGNLWVDTVGAAHVFADKDEVAGGLSRAELAVARQEVVEVYSLDVLLVDGEITPRTLKERIRTAGPTFRADLGKQARALPAARAA
ncbi:MAG: DUF2849 domain-containing protein [Stappiaceae bacterium]